MGIDSTTATSAIEPPAHVLISRVDNLAASCSIRSAVWRLCWSSLIIDASALAVRNEPDFCLTNRNVRRECWADGGHVSPPGSYKICRESFMVC